MNKKSLLQLSFALIITFILIIPTNMFVIAQVFPGDAINSPPIAHDQTISINEDSVVITLTGSDADGDALTFSIINAPSDGALSKISRLDPTSAELTYKPNLGASFYNIRRVRRPIDRHYCRWRGR